MTDLGAHIEGTPSPSHLRNNSNKYYVSNHRKFRHKDQLLALSRISGNPYILVPVYYHESALPSKKMRENPELHYDTLLEACYDTQPQASEKMKVGETPTQAAQRCALQEIGLASLEGSFRLLLKVETNGCKLYYFHLDISKCYRKEQDPFLYYTCLDECKKLDHAEDLYTDRVCLYITADLSLPEHREIIAERCRVREEDSLENIHDAGHVIFLLKKKKLARIVHQLQDEYYRIKDTPAIKSGFKIDLEYLNLAP